MLCLPTKLTMLYDTMHLQWGQNSGEGLLIYCRLKSTYSL